MLRSGWLVAAAAAAVALGLVAGVAARNNGAAPTPPMGWMSWERYACRVDCKKYPNSCINEKLYKDMADRLVADGYAALGYDTVSIDDCWTEMERDPVTHRLVANKTRFPSGIKALADYIHAKGLKFGIYSDVGTKTCAGYPGSLGYFELDAATFAQWGVDSLKFDGCNCNKSNYEKLYVDMGKALNKTGRKMVYQCSWPAYIVGSADFKVISQHCNMWRPYHDIFDTWDTTQRANSRGSVRDILTWWNDNEKFMGPHHGPNSWNDPDMIIVGNYGLSYEQSKSQMSLWAMFAAPLMLSNDLRDIKPWQKELMQNKDIIAIDQDPLGKMGKLVKHEERFMYFSKPLKGGRTAIAVHYEWIFAAELYAEIKLADFGIAGKADVREVWTGDSFTGVNKFSYPINPMGTAVFIVTPQK